MGWDFAAFNGPTDKVAQRNLTGVATRLPSLGPLRRWVAALRHELLFASPLKNAGLMLLL
jgi:hypothetical protein